MGAGPYQVVYPGPHGPIPTRQAEAFREGWDDFRLLSLLRDSGSEEAHQLIGELIPLVPRARDPREDPGSEQWRERLLEAAARLAGAAFSNSAGGRPRTPHR